MAIPTLFTLGGIIEVTPIDVVLVVLFAYVVWILFFKQQAPEHHPGHGHGDGDGASVLTPLEKRDMTIEELKKYNGVDDPHICLALCGKIFDVSAGKSFYGPGAAYGVLAGHDATRALATMDLKQVRDCDDHSNLKQDELQEAEDWMERLSMKYPFVGMLLKPVKSDDIIAQEQIGEEKSPSRRSSTASLGRGASKSTIEGTTAGVDGNGASAEKAKHSSSNTSLGDDVDLIDLSVIDDVIEQTPKGKDD